MVWLVDNIVEALRVFGQVAGNDPLSPLLLLFALGFLLTAVGVFGWLALGGIIAEIAPE
ncbi:MAG: hypothetical protein ABEJ71_01475 [Halodesulfurarchaeum sp.]